MEIHRVLNQWYIVNHMTDIVKLECIGHIQKRVGGRLRRLVKDYKGRKLDDGKSIGGRGRLSQKEIEVYK